MTYGRTHPPQAGKEAQAKKIVYYVSVHDNWALGKYKVYKDRVLSIFKDLDYIWMVSPKGFRLMKKLLKKNKSQMLKYLRDEGYKFSTKTTKGLFKGYLAHL